MQKIFYSYLIPGSVLLFSYSNFSFVYASEANDQPIHSYDTQQKSEEIIVRGTRKGIIAKNSSTATKDNTPLIETPESVSVVTRTQMDIQNARTITEALRYTAGVATDGEPMTSRFDQVSIRGFGQTSGVDQYLDDMRQFNGQFFATQQIDPYLLEKIEVLKGPASVVYGQSNPGGIIALTSKFANGLRIRNASLEGGNYNYVRGTVDLADKITESGSLSWRMVATSFRQDGAYRSTKNERYAFQPSVNWQPNDKTSLTVYARYQHDPTSNLSTAIPVYGSVLPADPFKFNRHFYIGDPNFNKLDRTQAGIGYQLAYKLDSNWKAVSMLRYNNVGFNYNQVYGNNYTAKNSSAGLIPGTDYMTRYADAIKEHFDTITLEERLYGKIQTGPLTHHTMIGVSWQNLRDSYNFGEGSAPNLNLYHPLYHQHIAIPATSMAAGVSTNQEGIFLQDQISYHRIRVQLGFRNDWSTIQTRGHLGVKNSSQSDQAFTFRGGILYLFPHGIAPYFNYAQSFQPLNQLDHNGKPFSPTKGEQYEVGVKYQPDNFEGFFTAALYNLTQSNTLTVDPSNALWNVQSGAIRSRGVELEAHTSPLPGLNLIAAYTYQDVKYLKDNSNLTGRRPARIPAQFFSAYAEYTLQSGKLADLGGGIGVRFVGNSIGDMQTLIKAPSYTLLDAQVHYKLFHLLSELKGMEAQFTAQNLLNKNYLASCYSQSSGCVFGEGRTVIGRLSYNW